MALNLTIYATIFAFLFGSVGAGLGVWHYRDLRDQAQQAKIAQHIVTVTKIEQVKSDTVEAKQIQDQKAIQVQYETIEKSIPIYIHDINPYVSDNFVRVLNNASRPDLSPAPALSPDTPSVFTASDAAANITDNYAICEANRSELAAFQSWWASVKDVK